MMCCSAKRPNLDGRGWAINEADGWYCPHVNRLSLFQIKTSLAEQHIYGGHHANRNNSGL